MAQPLQATQSWDKTIAPHQAQGQEAKDVWILSPVNQPIAQKSGAGQLVSTVARKPQVSVSSYRRYFKLVGLHLASAGSSFLYMASHCPGSAPLPACSPAPFSLSSWGLGIWTIYPAAVHYV